MCVVLVAMCATVPAQTIMESAKGLKQRREPENLGVHGGCLHGAGCGGFHVEVSCVLASASQEVVCVCVGKLCVCVGKL